MCVESAAIDTSYIDLTTSVLPVIERHSNTYYVVFMQNVTYDQKTSHL